MKRTTQQEKRREKKKREDLGYLGARFLRIF